jgi:hypothetical protein
MDFAVHLAEYEGSEHTSQYNQTGWREEEAHSATNKSIKYGNPYLI